MHNHDKNAHHHHHDTEITDIPADRTAVCLVTGDVIDKVEAEKLGHFRDYDGNRAYLCCATCVRLFDENPEKYTHKSHESHELTLTAAEHLIDNIWAFRFTSNQPLTWNPGQFIRIEIPHDNPDNKGTKRWFTITSTPHDGFLQITTRVTNTTFKQTLATLAVGDKVQLIERPDGDFVWQESKKPLVLVAGGIGITPFYSILKARGHSGLPVAATLIYNGRTDELPFTTEFEEASKRHPEFTVKYVIGELLTAKKLTKLVPDVNRSQVYISGPELMVDMLGNQLEKNGLASDNLHQDFFPYYNEADY